RALHRSGRWPVLPLAAVPPTYGDARRTPMLRAAAPSVVRGTNHVLKDVDLGVQADRLTTLIGPNGAGQSSRLAALSGHVAPTSGEVLLRGRAVRSYRPKQLALLRSVLPQDHMVRFSYSVEEIVQLARLSHEPDPDQDAQIVADSLAAAELS